MIKFQAIVGGWSFPFLLGFKFRRHDFLRVSSKSRALHKGPMDGLASFLRDPCVAYTSQNSVVRMGRQLNYFSEKTHWLAPPSRQIWQNILLMESWFIIIPYDPNYYCSTATFQSANHAIDKDDFDPFDDCLLFNNRYPMMMS